MKELEKGFNPLNQVYRLNLVTCTEDIQAVKNQVLIP